MKELYYDAMTRVPTPVLTELYYDAMTRVPTPAYTPEPDSSMTGHYSPAWNRLKMNRFRSLSARTLHRSATPSR